MIEAVHENFPSSNAAAGNDPQVRTWLGDVQSIPAYQVRSVLLSLPFSLSSVPLLSSSLHQCMHQRPVGQGLFAT